MKTYYYSTNYYPPAPVVEIVLISAAENLQVGPLTGMADSGADGTIIPINYLRQINAPSTDEMFIRSQWGERHRVLLYLVDMKIGDMTLYGCEVVGDKRSNEIVLGRDVLNQLRILHDGPAEAVEIWQ